MRVWDAATGRELFSSHLLPDGETAVLDGAGSAILHASTGAWRWLGWRWHEPATERVRILPAEFFGPLPA